MGLLPGAMGRTGLRICRRCRALEMVGDDLQRPCRICGFQPEVVPAPQDVLLVDG